MTFWAVRPWTAAAAPWVRLSSVALTLGHGTIEAAGRVLLEEEEEDPLLPLLAAELPVLATAAEAPPELCWMLPSSQHVHCCVATTAVAASRGRAKAVEKRIVF